MTFRKLLVCAVAAIGLLATPLLAATARLTDQEVKALLDRIETDRSNFEGALDDKLKNTTIKAERGEVKTNEFFDDLEDQVQRARDRFNSDYSASSEVISLLQYAVRLHAWTSTQPAGFGGSKEWGVLETDLRRLAAAYNTTLPAPGQQGTGTIAQAKRVNDAELVTAAANVEKKIDAFRAAYNTALNANTSLTPDMRQKAILQVDAMKTQAGALNAALAKKQKGLAEADALLNGTMAIADTTSKMPPNSTVAGAWKPLGDDLRLVALAYEVTPSRGL